MILKGKRIFLLEDSSPNRAIAQLMLERHGAQVFFERYGVNTLGKIRSAVPIDIILLDLMLPNNVTGYDVFTQISLQPDLRHIPVVAVSASDPECAIRRTKSLGFSGFIRKPISILHFAQQIADTIEGQAIWQMR